MQSLVISLKTAIERRKHIEHQFASKGVNFQFFDALTPEKAKPLAEKMSLIVKNECLTSGELACFMSHVSIWQKIVDEKIPYLAIFEDDIFLGENVADVLHSSVWIQSDWDVIKVEAFAETVLATRKYTNILDKDMEVFQLKSKNLGTAGYILSLNGAKKYLRYIHENTLIPLDEMIFDQFVKLNYLNIYQLNPAICIQEMKLYPQKNVLSSELLSERKLRVRKNKKKAKDKVKHELIRIFTQLKLALFGKKVYFK
jgi:glycosyl transferase, family 25